jgi:flagellar biosynthetic protein FliR
VISLQVDPVWVTSSLLLWLRLAALFFASPVFAGFKGPNSTLAIVSLGLAGLLAAASPVLRHTPDLSLGGLFVAALGEVFIGTVLAFGVHAAFAAFDVAGRLIDLQIGFGAGATFDPVSGHDAPVLAAALSALGAVVFFALDAHHALLRGVAFSMTEIPPGTSPKMLFADAILRQFGAVFTLALSLAAPVLFMLLLLETGLAALSRLLPQMNVFFVGLPMKIVVGLSVLALSAPALPGVMGRVYASIFAFWGTVLLR